MLEEVIAQRKTCRVLDRATMTQVWYEECSAKEWDSESEYTREFINFGEGFTFARQIRKREKPASYGVINETQSQSHGW